MRRIVSVVLLLVMVLMKNPSMVEGTESRLDLDIVYSAGDWDEVTPMHVKTTDPDDYKIAQVNATNLNDENLLYKFQYMKYIIDFINWEPPTVDKQNIDYYFYNILNFTTDNTVIRIAYWWSLSWDTGVVLYEGNLRLFVNSSLLFNEDFVTYGKTHQVEVQLWRTKSDQIGIYYQMGEESTEDGLEIYSQMEHWDIGNFTYWFSDDETNTGYFEAIFEDMSFQSGSDEGIQDPIENPDWGFFDPIRQILMTIINFWIGVVKIILPNSIENIFDDLLDSLEDFVVPVTEMITFVLDNFLELLILVNLALLMNGVAKAESGDISGIIIPFVSFYGFMFSLAFTIINFIVAVIKALWEALPFI